MAAIVVLREDIDFLNQVSHLNPGCGDVTGRAVFPLFGQRGSRCGLLRAMYGAVTCRAKRDQVDLGIVAAVATKFLVVNFEVGPCAARLACPTVPT